MPTFSYTARDLNGVDHKGSIETVDEHQIAQILGKKGLILIKAKIQQEQGSKLLDKYLNRVSFADLVIATRQLATMIESGLVLSEALDILIDQQSSKKLKQTFSDVSRDIKSGLDLATALRKHPDVFPSIYCSLVKSGEQSGKLDVVLTQMATSLERDREFRAKIRGAMIYPILVISMMGVVGLIMMFFVVPKLLGLYTQSNIELPLPTKILIGTSNFMINFWPVMLIALIIGFFVFKKWVSKPNGRYTFDKILLRIPVISKIIQNTTLTNFTRTFGLLTTAGIPLLDSLSIVVGVVDNSVYKRALEATFKGVERGLPFSTQLESVGIFPKIVPQMFRVGEETGKVDKVSYKMAEYFESEADNLVKNLTVILEPIILIVLGLGVAFLVLSVILPIYKLTTSVT